MDDYNELLTGATGQQQKWFWAWIKTLDPTEAAKTAGYADPVQSGWINRHSPNLKAAVNAYLESLAMPAHEVIARYYEMATGTMEDFLTFDSQLSPEEKKPKTAVTPLEGGKVAAVPVYEDGVGYRLDLEKARKRGKLGNVKKYTSTERKYFDRGRGVWVTETQTAVELYSKKDALDKLGEYHGIWKTGANISFIKNEVVAILRAGQIDPQTVIETLGEDLARGLFAEAGIQETKIVEQLTQEDQK